MARKTNKTAHVLNLLSSGTAKQEQDELSREKTISPNISIIDSTGLSDSLTDLIKDSLDKEMSAAELAPSRAGSYLELPDAQESYVQGQESIIQEEAFLQPDTEVQKQSQTSEELNKELLAAPDTKMVTETETLLQAELKPDTAALDELPDISGAGADVSESDPPCITDFADKKEPLYRYVNIMEHLVEDRLLEFMQRFQVCTCDRCQMDTKALALNSLPPKYIVTSIEAINPLMSFYENKYSIYSITELTKACLTILDHPRH